MQKRKEKKKINVFKKNIFMCYIVVVIHILTINITVIAKFSLKARIGLHSIFR